MCRQSLGQTSLVVEYLAGFDKGRPGREQSGVALADGMQFLASALLASRRSRYATAMAPVVVSPVKRASFKAGKQASALLNFGLIGCPDKICCLRGTLHQRDIDGKITLFEVPTSAFVDRTNGYPFTMRWLRSGTVAQETDGWGKLLSSVCQS